MCSRDKLGLLVYNRPYDWEVNSMVGYGEDSRFAYVSFMLI